MELALLSSNRSERRFNFFLLLLILFLAEESGFFFGIFFDGVSIVGFNLKSKTKI
jgi:hypothetical protein